MAKIRGYSCSCGHSFEYTFLTPAEETTMPACPVCCQVVNDDDEILGGQPFGTIVPMYRGSLKQKAGYQHHYANRPAEKTSISVPRNKGNV